MTYYSCILGTLLVCSTSGKRGEVCHGEVHTPSSLIPRRRNTWRQLPENIRHRIAMSCGPRLSSLLPKACPTKRSASGWTCPDRSYRSGVNVSSTNASSVWKNDRGADDREFFPPEIVVEIKALACQLPKDLGLPFSRLSRDEIARQAVKRGVVASISGATVWRWLSADAIRPWCYRSWIWPRDPYFEQRAGRVLDLYHRTWNAKALGKNDFVVCSDEKTSIQARRRLVPTLPPIAGRAGRVEHEYDRQGALAYLAAWDVHHAKLFGLCCPSTGIAHFHDLVDLVMNQQPYRLPSGPKGHGPPSQLVSECYFGQYAGACQLAQPSRDLLLYLAT
jgi:hypothetical protein